MTENRIYVPMSGHTDDWRSNVPTCTVIEPEPFMKFSGLLDAHGNRLGVMLQSDPIGFVHFPPK